MKSYNIAVIGGDGTGPEVTREAIKVLDVASKRFGIKLNYTDYDLGGDRYRVTRLSGDRFLISQVEEGRRVGIPEWAQTAGIYARAGRFDHRLPAVGCEAVARERGLDRCRIGAAEAALVDDQHRPAPGFEEARRRVAAPV